MKKIQTILAVAMLLFGAVAVATANEIGLFGGAAIPRGQTAEESRYGQKTGWEIGGFYTATVSRSLGVRGSLSHRQLPNEVEIKNVSSMKITEFAVDAKIRTCDRYAIKPYLLFGVGLAQINILVDVESTDLHVTSSSTEMTLHGGAGLDVDLSGKLDLFVETMIWEGYYVSLIPVRAGFRLAI